MGRRPAFGGGRRIVATAAMWLCLAGAAHATLFVYQMPDGSRIITDHALDNPDYRLIRVSDSPRGMGALVSQRQVESAVINPAAYDRLIRRVASVEHVDVSLVKAVMHVESGFDPHAVSPKGASGLMQLMPETAQRYGVRDIFDPVQNVYAGVRYLKHLLVKFHYNRRLALAAYNAGVNVVMQYNGIPPFEETQTYVRRVMRYRREYSRVTHVARRRVVRSRLVAARRVRPGMPVSVPVADSRVAVRVSSSHRL